ncbi:MAG: peptidoglycan DD-metalloendopeptidase family protein [Myxococcota bacterium]|nr:peptidoglycan DD-metalloendopeptidase family protein [Myxococcota bacterium]
MPRRSSPVMLGWLLVATFWFGHAHGQPFEYNPPGQLVDGSGQGRVDEQVYAPNMRFPIEDAPAFANSQVWGIGGSQGPAGSQCDPRNYRYPWFDNYCESRTHSMPFCPTGTGHQGQDIRPATCEDKRWWAVVAESGQVATIGDYWVYIASDSGNFHGYLHLDPRSLTVSVGDRVQRGERLGLISNWFNGTPTTIHLHYEILQRINGSDPIHMPTYMSLVKAYEALLNRPGMQAPAPAPCALLSPQGGILDNRSDCFQRFGPARTWRMVDNAGYDGDFIWTYAWENATPSNWVRWQLVFEEAGRYRIENHVVPEYAQSRRTPYSIQHGGQESEALVDLTSNAPWVLVGEFDFQAGANQWVDQFDNTGENRDLELKVMADALRITRVGDGAEQSMDDGRGGSAGHSDDSTASNDDPSPSGSTPSPEQSDADATTAMPEDLSRTGADANEAAPTAPPPLVQTEPNPNSGMMAGEPIFVDAAAEGGHASGCGCRSVSSMSPTWCGWMILIGLVRAGRRMRHRNGSSHGKPNGSSYSI